MASGSLTLILFSLPVLDLSSAKLIISCLSFGLDSGSGVALQRECWNAILQVPPRMVPSCLRIRRYLISSRLELWTNTICRKPLSGTQPLPDLHSSHCRSTFRLNPPMGPANPSARSIILKSSPLHRSPTHTLLRNMGILYFHRFHCYPRTFRNSILITYHSLDIVDYQVGSQQ